MFTWSHDNHGHSSVYIYIYILHIYICVCVCVCVRGHVTKCVFTRLYVDVYNTVYVLIVVCMFM